MIQVITPVQMPNDFWDRVAREVAIRLIGLAPGALLGQSTSGVVQTNFNVGSGAAAGSSYPERAT